MLRNFIKKQFSYSVLASKQRKPSLFSGGQFDINSSHLTPKLNPNRQKLFDDLCTFEQQLPVIRTSSTNLKGKELQKYIQANYYSELMRKESEDKKNKIIPKMGDKVEIEYYLSISSGKLNRFKGVIVAIHHKGTPEFAFTFYTNVEGHYVTLRFNYFSNIIKSIVLITESEMKPNENYLIGYKKLGYVGQKGGLILKGGKNMKVNKRDILNLKSSLKTEEDQNKTSSSTIYDI